MTTCAECGVECATCRERARSRDAYRVGYDAGRAEVGGTRSGLSLADWRALMAAVHPDRNDSPAALRAAAILNRIRPKAKTP